MLQNQAEQLCRSQNCSPLSHSTHLGQLGLPCLGHSSSPLPRVSWSSLAQLKRFSWWHHLAMPMQSASTVCPECPLAAVVLSPVLTPELCLCIAWGHGNWHGPQRYLEMHETLTSVDTRVLTPEARPCHYLICCYRHNLCEEVVYNLELQAPFWAAILMSRPLTASTIVGQMVWQGQSGVGLVVTEVCRHHKRLV